MPIVSTDIFTFGAASMSEINTGSIGGQMSTGLVIKVTFATLTTTGFIWAKSNGADVSTLRVMGRNAAGATISETITLNGTATVKSVNQFERLLKANSINDPATIQYILKSNTNPTTGTLMTFRSEEHTSE